jgi:photosystem II stability/assembly factor-like uncharacterized protein
MGGAWLNADVGLFLNAALTVAVDPRDPNHLLMGSDLGLLASTNGGRSWAQEAPALINGAVFAVAFSLDGSTVLCATPGGIYRATEGFWRQSDAPAGALPSRGIVFGEVPGRVFLLGRDKLFSSSDGGEHFARLPMNIDDDGAFETLAILRRPVEMLFAVAHGRLMVGTDGGRHWEQRAVTGTTEPVDTVTADPVAGRVWVAAANRLYVSNDSGANWQAIGTLLPQLHTTVRGIASDPTATTLVVTTHRGTYRSVDAGAHWMLEEGSLPVHLEAGPLARDPADPRILYVVYSLIPYPEVWRSALEGSNRLPRVDPLDLIGGLAVLALLSIGGMFLVTRLERRRRATVGAAQ